MGYPRERAHSWRSSRFVGLSYWQPTKAFSLDANMGESPSSHFCW